MEVLKKLGIDFINRVWPDPGPVGRLTYPPANLWVPDLSILQVNPNLFVLKLMVGTLSR